MRLCPPLKGRASVLLAAAAAFAAAASLAGEPAAAKKAEAGDILIQRSAYALIRPEGWSQAAGVSPRVDLTLACDTDPGVNISIATAPAGVTREITDAEAAELKEMFKGSIPGYEVTAEEWMQVDGTRAYRVSARYALNLGGPALAMQNAQVLFVKGDTFYTVTYTSTPGLFLKHLGDFDAVLESFRAGGGAPAAPTAAGTRAPARP